MKYLIFISLLLIILSGCFSGGDYTPKPRGYFKIDLPEKKYQTYNGACNYSFDYPVYASVFADSSKESSPCWLNIAFQQFNSRIHLSYQPFTSPKTFNALVEDARKLAFTHTVKATAIDEAWINYPDHKVYGIFYTIKGNTASSIQFFLTDSTKNYLRGALYFNELPRQDSIQPVLDFIKKDIDVMIKTFRWEN
ncbi:MAG: gliding motility lipoprotein GldD [Sphingobacteriaceae bacterium]|nr:gliding motility lipoprotein GldD [Sphingobacteriaceae bacterium]